MTKTTAFALGFLTCYALAGFGTWYVASAIGYRDPIWAGYVWPSSLLHTANAITDARVQK